MKQDRQPIDFVISWVDGSDPEWRRQCSSYQRENSAVEAWEHGTIDLQEIRYRDWDNLKYWFRAVEKYAPWVNQVHFISCGQIPTWLNLEHPKLHVVDHKDYIPEEYLPTFSSHPIELNLHRIPGLAEQFVYFNDDFFLTAPVQPEDFFVDGLPCDSITEDPIEMPGSDMWNSIRMNDTMFASRHFDRAEVKRKLREKWFSLCSPRDCLKNLIMSMLNKQYFFGIAVHHLPQAYRKEALEAVWKLEEALLRETSSHKFRDRRDVSQVVFKYYQLLSGRFHPCNMRKKGWTFSGNWDPKAAARVIAGQKYKMICINDSMALDFDSAKEIVNSAFESVLGEKCSFERD